MCGTLPWRPHQYYVWLEFNMYASCNKLARFPESRITPTFAGDGLLSRENIAPVITLKAASLLRLLVVV
ncbi:MAG: hypothetical protein QXW98_07675 [Candidatus Caldarchaeum sp.]